jgi:DNA-binding NtrC family response regulator
MPETKKLVLCVDDHKDSIGFMSVWLAQQGYEVKAACSYAEALMVIQSNHVDLSILDARMGDGDGFDLCKTILAKSPTTKVILNSGDTRPEMKDLAKKAGAKAFFGKPINFDEMDSVIHELIG